MSKNIKSKKNSQNTKQSNQSKKDKKVNNTKKNKLTKPVNINVNAKPAKPAKLAEVEYEGRILDINPDDIRNRAKSLGGKCKAPLTLYRRSVFKLCDLERGFVRVRDEGDKTTMTAKIFKNKDFPEETELVIKDGFETGQSFLRALNLTEKAYHETIREKWFIPRRAGSPHELCELTIDYIPGLPPYSEIECKSQRDLRKACKLLGFKYSDLVFGGYGNVFVHYYGMAANDINNDIPRLTFKECNQELEKYIHKNRELLEKCAKDNLIVYQKVKSNN